MPAQKLVKPKTVCIVSHPGERPPIRLSPRICRHDHLSLSRDFYVISPLQNVPDGLSPDLPVVRTQIAFLANPILPLVTIVPSTVAVPSTNAASPVIFRIVTSSIMV